MSKPIIAIDLDDVIADGTESLRTVVNELTGSNLTKEQYHEEKADYWGYYERVWMRHGIADKVSFKDLNAEMAIDQSHVPVLAGAQFALGELSKKYELIIVTARDVSWERATKAWLKDQLGSLSEALHFAGRKD